MKRFGALFLLLAGAVSFAAAVPDPVGSLIDSEKEAEQKWLEESHEIPPVFVWGDETGVEIDNPRDIGNTTVLCSEIAYDQWLAITDGDTAAPEVELNLALPRLRDALSETCLVRPTDRVVAVGKGWQKEVPLGTFLLRRGAAVCPDQFPYSLWSKIDGGLPSAPLFYTTQLDVGERDNLFAPPDWEKLTIRDAEMRQLEPAVPRLSEYTVSMSSMGASNADALFFFGAAHGHVGRRRFAARNGRVVQAIEVRNALAGAGKS